MAVRFDADGESYTRSTGLGSVTVFSFACWVKLAVDRAATTVILQIDSGIGTSRLRLNAWNGSALTFQTDSGGWFGTIGHSLVVGQWTFVGLSATANPGQARTAVRAAGSTTFAGGSPTQANVAFNAATLRIGDGQAASEWLNGSVAAVKVWDQALTMEELQNESWTYQPRRTAGLRGWYPLLAPSTVDYSGLAQTLSGGAGSALDDPPPIAWSAGRRRIAIPAAGVTAALAGTLPAATASTAGTVEVAGSLAGTLPAAAASTAGMVTVAGSLAATAPTPTAALVGDIEGNVLAGVLPAATAAMAGSVKVSGTAAGVLPAAAGVFAGDVEIPANDITVTAGEPVRGWNAAVVDDGMDAAAVARGWDAAPQARSWESGGGRRGWTAGPPTT